MEHGITAGTSWNIGVQAFGNMMDMTAERLWENSEGLAFLGLKRVFGLVGAKVDVLNEPNELMEASLLDGQSSHVMKTFDATLQ